MGESLIVRKGGGGAFEIDGQQIITGEYAEAIQKFDTVGVNLIPEVLGDSQWDTTIDKLANLATIPGNTSFDTAFSPDGTYFGVGHDISPYITIYKRDGDTFTKLTDPATLPPTTGQSASFSSDGTYLVVAHFNSPFITIYKRNGDTFTKVTNPATLPTATAFRTNFSPDSTYLAVAHTGLPIIAIYKTTLEVVETAYNEIVKADNESYIGQDIGYALESGDVGDTKSVMKLFNGANVAGQEIIEGVFAEDISRLDSVAANLIPEVPAESEWDTTINKLANPSNLPGQVGLGTAFSPDNTYLAVAHVGSPFIHIYKRDGDTFTKLADPAILPGPFEAVSTAFSPDGTYLAVVHFGSPFVTIYKRSGDTFTKLANPSTLPPDTGRDTAFSPNSTYLSVAHSSSP